jgi:hypothetical protein
MEAVRFFLDLLRKASKEDRLPKLQTLASILVMIPVGGDEWVTAGM